MKALLIGVAVVALICSVTDANAAKRKNVYINKPSPPGYVPEAVPLVAVPPFAVAFDLARRTSCDPRVAVSTGKCDPGFDTSPGCPLTGNFLLPAINRIDSYCYKPK